jgi:RNA methyltransferase, TrmH family
MMYREERITLITSRENRLVKEYTALRDQKSRRRETGRFVTEGARLATDALSSGVKIAAAFITAQAREKYEDCCLALERSGAPVYDVAPAVASLLSDTRSTQGIFCVVEMPRGNLLRGNLLHGNLDIRQIDPKGAYLALEDIQDPGNLGTMLRTAEAMGIGGVLLSEGCTDAFSPKAVRASMGAVFRLPFCAGVHMPDAAALLSSNGIKVYAAVADGGDDILAADLCGGVAAVIGNEGNGLTRECINACSGRITVRMRGRAESLNAAAAATVIIWEMTKGLR